MKSGGSKIFTKRVRVYLLLACCGILLYFALTNLKVILEWLSQLFIIFRPFIYGAIIAFLLDIPMRFVEARLFAKFQAKRILALLATYFSAFVLIFLLFWLVMPQIIESTLSLLGNANQYLDNLNELMDYISVHYNIGPEGVDQFRLSYEDIIDKLLTMVRETLPDIVNISMKIGSSVVSGLTAVIASIYMLASKEKLFTQCRRALYAFVPKRAADSVRSVLHLSVSIFSSFISGKILDSVIIGLICFIGLTLINATFAQMPFIPLISVIVAVTNIIPFFGPFLGAIPSAMIILIVNPMSALWFTVFIVILQQFDGNILGPRILGGSTGLPPLWVLIAIIVGGGLFGFPGMIAGVPAIAVLHTLTREVIDNRLQKGGFSEDANYVSVNPYDDLPGSSDPDNSFPGNPSPGSHASSHAAPDSLASGSHAPKQR